METLSMSVIFTCRLKDMNDYRKGLIMKGDFNTHPLKNMLSFGKNPSLDSCSEI